MSWSMSIAKIGGTTIRIHLTFVMLVIGIGIADYIREGRAAAVNDVTFILLLFLCVLVHELGHVTAARCFGIATRDITLLPIGGVARLERDPENATHELIVTLAGPAVSLAIAAILFLMHGTVEMELLRRTEETGGLVGRLAGANLFLALFNLLPAFPLDGGRAFRAALTYERGHDRATEIATQVSQTLALGLVVIGLFTNVTLTVIGIIVYLAAFLEMGQVKMHAASGRLLAGDAVTRQFSRLLADASIEQAREVLVRTRQHEFPVVASDGTMLGMVTESDLTRALRQDPSTPVRAIMRSDIPVVSANDPLSRALHLMLEEEAPAVFVRDAGERVIGFISLEKLTEILIAPPDEARSRTVRCQLK